MEELLSREREFCDGVEDCLALRLWFLPLTSGVRAADSSASDGCSVCGTCCEGV